MLEQVSVSLGYLLYLDRSGQKVSQLLMLFSPAAFSRRSVLVQSHVIVSSSVRVLVECGCIRVVPVLLELLTENTLCCQLLRPIEFTFLIHPQIKTSVHTSNAHQPDGQTDKLQNTESAVVLSGSVHRPVGKYLQLEAGAAVELSPAQDALQVAKIRERPTLQSALNQTQSLIQTIRQRHIP